MENLQPGEGSGASGVAAESSDSTFQLNIKTLDSRIFSFDVDKKILVSDFKEKIASQVSVPVGQQRLIFRGKVLKDEHLLSEYNVEHGDTLHLVERQPQPPPGPNTQDATSGHDFSSGGPHNRIGHIAHSVVMGTLNAGDQGDVAPDLSRVIGAVLNSIAMSNLAGGMPPGVQAPHGNETERSPTNAGSQVQGGHFFGPFQALNGQTAANPMQIPVGTATAVPSLNMPIPDSLNTLTEFMNRMESVLSQNGTQPIQSPTVSDSPPTPELPVNSHGFPTVEALTTVLRHAQRLLSDHVVPAVDKTAGRLDQEGGSTDPAIRGQVQTESVQLGVAMQHLGALLLELGRTILTLRIGQSSDGSFLNAGPAVYISPNGPNPIMVQPFPLQTSSLFGGSGVTQIPVPMGPFGSVTRNVNIHIHTGASLESIAPTMGNRAPNGDEIQGQVANGAPGEFVQAQAPGEFQLRSILDGGNKLPFPDGILINGRPPNATSFTIEQGKTYRLRMCNVGLQTSLNFRIQSHKMKVVEVEGTHTEQVSYSSLDLHVGQCSSVLVTSDQPPNNYLVLVSTRFTTPVLTTTAHLSYANSNGAHSSDPIPGGPTTEIDWSINQARSLRTNLSASGPRPNPQGSYHYGMINTTRTIRLAGSAGQVDNKQRYAINSVSFKPDDENTPLKLADYFKIDGVFRVGSVSDGPTGGGIYPDTSVIGADYRAFVEIVFENPEDVVLTYHLSGYSFFVVGMEGGQWTTASKNAYNLRDAVSRSTVQVYPNSWTAVYLPLDNVGMWNLRTEFWARQYLGQQTYLRVYTASTSLRDEYPIPKNALLCGKASGRHTRSL